MASGIYVAMSGARNQSHRLDTLSNDLANANTPGFKAQETIYRQVHNDATALGNPNQAMGLNHPVRFLPEDRLPSVMDARFTKFKQGALRPTGNELDSLSPTKGSLRFKVKTRPSIRGMEPYTRPVRHACRPNRSTRSRRPR